MTLFDCVIRTMNEREEMKLRWNLRHREERADFERRAYFPRIDMGEQPPLRPGYHTDGERGWME